jgi:predicted O-methyltransferase YrrM
MLSQVSYESDEDFHWLYERAQENTQMSNSDNPLRRMRHYNLNCFLRNTDITKGDVAEIGCFRGLSAYQIAHHIQSREENADVTLHLFDSFEGLSEIQVEDKPIDRQQDAAKLQEQFACPLETVMKNLKEYNFIEYYKGWVPTRFDEVKDRHFSFVHIDVDLYQPIRDSVDFFYPRLTKNGIIVFDDYGYSQFPGAKKAVDEYVGSLENVFFTPLVTGQALLIKLG